MKASPRGSSAKYTNFTKGGQELSLHILLHIATQCSNTVKAKKESRRQIKNDT